MTRCLVLSLRYPAVGVELDMKGGVKYVGVWLSHELSLDLDTQALLKYSKFSVVLTLSWMSTVW